MIKALFCQRILRGMRTMRLKLQSTASRLCLRQKWVNVTMSKNSTTKNLNLEYKCRSWWKPIYTDFNSVVDKSMNYEVAPKFIYTQIARLLSTHQTVAMQIRFRQKRQNQCNPCYDPSTLVSYSSYRYMTLYGEQLYS